MARIVSLLCAFGVACGAVPDDATALFQTMRQRLDEQDTEMADLALQPPTYADGKYGVGEFVEGKTQRGGWVPCIVTQGSGGFYSVHVADGFPGYDLPNVPSALLRRPLTNDTKDYLVDNSKLKHPGHGLRYRHSKQMSDKSREYAKWDVLVIGHDEQDGWISTAVGYLPRVVNGSQVLKEVERKGGSTVAVFDKFLASLRANMSNSVSLSNEARHEDGEPKAGPLPLFEAGEWAEFRTKSGQWHPCQVRSLGSKPFTYNIVVRPTDFSVYPVNNARRENMRKIGRQPHEIKEGESPVCRRGGCVTIQVDDEQGHQYTVQLAKQGKVDMLMRTVCNRMKMEWEKCRSHVTFKHKGEAMNASTHVLDSGLQDQDLVVAELPSNELEQM